jgi:hypothetical protein
MIRFNGRHQRKEMKSILLLLGCWVFIITPVLPRSLNDENEWASLIVITNQIRPVAQCIPQSQLSKNLFILRSYLSGDELFKAKHSLMSIAKRSAECRTQVIQALITAMKQPGKDNGLGGVDSETYALWDNGADLLGELQATEALDLLIANFGLTDGLSSSLGHYPALGPVITMGQLSIPKLQEVLSKNPEPFRRKFAVFCLASIGGRTAKNVLAKALSAETDPCVKKFISISLAVFDNKTKPNQITAEENGRWYSYVYCS